MDLEALLKAVTGLLSLIGVIVLGRNVRRDARNRERLEQNRKANEANRKATQARRDYHLDDPDERHRRMLDAARKDSDD